MVPTMNVRLATTIGVAIFVFAALGSLAPACSGSAEGEPGEAPHDATGDATRDAQDDGTLVPPDTRFEFPDVPNPDTAFPSGDAPDAGELPAVPCGDAAVDAEPPWAPWDGAPTDGGCPLPPSYCVDRAWLASYVNGVCEDGVCRYWRVLHDCTASGASFCFSGHCQTVVGK